MRVDMDDMLGQCPDECPYADVEVCHESIGSADGVALVRVAVSCGHMAVCRHRLSRLIGGDRVGDD